jgi:hypothetical protein
LVKRNFKEINLIPKIQKKIAKKSHSSSDFDNESKIRKSDELDSVVRKWRNFFTQKTSNLKKPIKKALTNPIQR